MARALPLAAAEAVFHGLGAMTYATMRRRRAVVADNLRRIHGSPPSVDSLRRETRAAFVSYARYWMESFRLPGTTHAEMDAHMSCEGLEHFQEALAHGQGVIMALPHIGNWDFAGAWLAGATGVRPVVVAEPVRPPELFSWFSQLRLALGLDLVPLGPEAGTAVLRRLRAGGVVGLLCDRDILGGGIEVDFFGERTTLPSGPATLALRTGAPILPATVYFRGRRHHHGVIRPAVPMERAGRFGDDVRRVTQDLAREFEVLIRRAPEQWHVFQPNWPSAPAPGRAVP